MSEPSSIYVSVRLSEDRYNAWLASPLKNASDFRDWESMHPQWERGWEDDFYRLDVATVGELLTLWAADEDAESPWVWGYDRGTQTFSLAQLMFDEDLVNMAICLAVFRGLADFKDTPEPGYAYIFSYLWDNTADALLEITPGRSRFLDVGEVPPDFADEASSRWEALLDFSRDSSRH